MYVYVCRYVHMYIVGHTTSGGWSMKAVLIIDDLEFKYIYIERERERGRERETSFVKGASSNPKHAYSSRYMLYIPICAKKLWIEYYASLLLTQSLPYFLNGGN